jgi:hypothetical protein
MAEYYRVLRPFTGPNNERFLPGRVVDGSAWRNAPKLASQGRLLPCAAPEPAPAKKEAPHAQSRH